MKLSLEHICLCDFISYLNITILRKALFNDQDYYNSIKEYVNGINSLMKEQNKKNKKNIITTNFHDENDKKIKDYLALNIFYEKMDVSKIFYYARACTISSGTGPKPENQILVNDLEKFYKEYFSDIFGKQLSRTNIVQILNYACTLIETSYKVNTSEHFITRIRKLINLFKPDNLEKKEWNKIKNIILKRDKNNVPENCLIHYDRLEEFFPKKFEKHIKYDAKIFPEKYLYYTIKINLEIDKYNQEADKLGKKPAGLIQPIPLRNSSIPCYIRIDKAILKDYFKSTWENFFDINKLKFSKNLSLDDQYYKFASISTDGIAVSISYQLHISNAKKLGFLKAKQKDKKDEDIEDDYKDDIYLEDLSPMKKKEYKNRKIIGVDPGKQSMVYILEANEKGKKTYLYNYRKYIEKK